MRFFVTAQVIIEAESVYDAENIVENAIVALDACREVSDTSAEPESFDGNPADLTLGGSDD